MKILILIFLLIPTLSFSQSIGSVFINQPLSQEEQTWVGWWDIDIVPVIDSSLDVQEFTLDGRKAYYIMFETNLTALRNRNYKRSVIKWNRQFINQAESGSIVILSPFIYDLRQPLKDFKKYYKQFLRGLKRKDITVVVAIQDGVGGRPSDDVWGDRNPGRPLFERQLEFFKIHKQLCERFGIIYQINIELFQAFWMEGYYYPLWEFANYSRIYGQLEAESEYCYEGRCGPCWILTGMGPYYDNTDFLRDYRGETNGS